MGRVLPGAVRVTALPARPSSGSASPRIPGQPLEQDARRGAEMVGLQAACGHVHGLAFPGSSRAARRGGSGEIKCSQGPLQQQLDPCPQGLLIPSCSGQEKTLDLNLWGLPVGPEETDTGCLGASWGHHLVTCWDAQGHRTEDRQQGKWGKTGVCFLPSSQCAAHL